MAIRSSLFWTVVAQILLFIIQFGGTLIVTRLLNPVETGTFALCMAIMGVFSVLQSHGLSMYIVRERDCARQVAITAFTINSVAACIVSLIALLIAKSVFFNLDNSQVRYILLIISIVPIISIFEFAPCALLERQGSFRPIVLINVCRNFVGSASAITLALHGHGAASLAYGQLASATFGMLMINFVGRQHVILSLSLLGAKQMLVFSFQMIGVNGLSRIGQRISEILIGGQLGLDALGVYNRASSIFSLIWENLHSTLARVLFVNFSNAVREGKPLRDRYLVVVEVMTSLLWPAFSGLSILSSPIIYFLYGEKWSAAAGPLSIISISAILLVSMTMSWELFIVKGETAKQIKLESIRTVASISMVAGGASVGLSWVAASKIGDSIVANILYRRYIMQFAGVNKTDLIKIYIRSGTLTLFAIGPCVYNRLRSEDWVYTSPSLMLESIILGFTLWFIVVVLINHPIFREILRLTGKSKVA